MTKMKLVQIQSMLIKKVEIKNNPIHSRLRSQKNQRKTPSSKLCRTWSLVIQKCWHCSKTRRWLMASPPWSNRMCSLCLFKSSGPIFMETTLFTFMIRQSWTLTRILITLLSGSNQQTTRSKYSTAKLCSLRKTWDWFLGFLRTRSLKMLGRLSTFCFWLINQRRLKSGLLTHRRACHTLIRSTTQSCGRSSHLIQEACRWQFGSLCSLSGLISLGLLHR